MQKKVVMSNVSDPASNNLNRFAGDASKGFKIDPEQTLQFSVIFILIVFVLHILGKIVGFSAAPATSPVAPDVSEGDAQ
jgi:hypothetical protein